MAALRRISKQTRPVRYLSNAVTFTSIDRSQSLGKVSANSLPSTSCKLRVPLLKSPSHLGHYTSRVNRLYNEDKYSAFVLDIEDREVFNFNIFDGHGGKQCLSFLHSTLGQSVENLADLVNDPDMQDKLFRHYGVDIGGYWKRWYKQKKSNLERILRAVPQIPKLSRLQIPPDDLMIRIPLAFLRTDYQFLQQEDNELGSACTSAFLETVFFEQPGEFRPVYESYFFNRKTISKLTIAQVGDTKAILVDRTGEAHPLTIAHHPSNPMESSRLRKYLTNYFMTDSFGEERFISLANTRSFGDLKYKEMGVTAEPDVAQYIIGDLESIQKKLTPDEIKAHTIGGLGGDELFLILCTDGVSNELTDQEIADLVMSNFNLKGNLKATPQQCAEEVVRFVEYIGGDDNATCLVIHLNGWGKWPALDRTGQLRQERLNAYHPRDRG
ncbi:protein serine/threonine phosphatase 2C [Metschnikowia bicuspidata]|uniref:Protein serine/threonine phosphatase 2C n=1 Tax=Metschnikowia bicuspidata TaxID=27322 RepID=A0A4P9Z750_9ASCO|nr:protein serine/threonine phosphatase 2C [Metschnikowia bicuspidata]RKP29118.1 protein serine/threonine phosphatase 2C [Metschnikowia bicuspidata]